VLTNVNILKCLRRVSRDRSGFTLLEIMLVMSLMGVFIAVTMPNFNKIIPEMKVDKAASKLAADMRMAQQRAISEMVVVRFRPEVAGDRYYAMVKGKAEDISDYWLSNSQWWLNDLDDEYVTDPLKSSENVLMDFNDPDSKFYGLEIESMVPGYADGTTWGIYISPLGDMRFPYENVTITIRDPRTGYSRSVLMTYPMGKVSVLP